MSRVYYHLESSGKERLKILLEDYYTTNRAIQNILNYTGEEDTYEKEQQ